MAEAGAGSRRHCENLIRSGRVTVDGQTVTSMGYQVAPLSSQICLDGRRLQSQKKVYIALNKPPGILCTNQDTHGRCRVAELLPSSLPRVYPVGRLDKDSEGLLLLTNDGDFSLRLTHPRYKIAKTYHVEIEGRLTQQQTKRLVRGVVHDGEHLRAVSVSDVRVSAGKTNLKIVLAQGRKRQIRRMLSVVGHRVIRLRRTRVGPLCLGKLKSAQWRYLSDNEVQMLRNA